MAVADKSSTPAPTDWKKRESLGSALTQIAIAAVVLAGIVFYLYQKGAKQQATKDGVETTRNLALRDNAQDLQAALATVDGLLSSHSGFADGHALAADLHTELWLVHRVPGADAKAKEHLAAAEQGGARIEERFASKALALLADGKVTEAEQYVDGLRKEGRSSARIWHALGRAYQEQGSLELARLAFAQAMDKAWKDPRFSAAFGEALLLEGQYAQAQEMLGKGLAIAPEHVRSRLALSLAQLRRRERVKDAQDTVSELLSREAELTPGMKARTLAVKSELAIFDQKYDDALKAADEALAVYPQEEFALLAKARALALKNDASALDAFKSAIAQRKTAPLFYLDGASMLQTAGNGDGAMALLQAYETQFKDVSLPAPDGKVVHALDRDDRYWLARGDVLRLQNKLDDAMASYDRAVATGTVNVVKAHYAKAQVFLAKNEQDKALESLSLVAPADGTGVLPEAYVTVGELLFQKKQYAEGCQQFAHALSRLVKQQQPREKLTALRDDVNKRLTSAGQKPMAKMWLDETKMMVQ